MNRSLKTKYLPHIVKKQNTFSTIPGEKVSDVPWTPSSPTSYEQPSESCFIAGTKVKMSDGTEKNIEDIVVGDMVIGHTQINTVVELDPVILGDRKLYSFNGGPYFVTSEHPMLTADGWKSIKPEKTRERDGEELYNELVGKLKKGDMLITVDGEVELKSIESKDGHDADIPLYNFHLEGDKSYSADGYFAHNMPCGSGGGGNGPCEGCNIGACTSSCNCDGYTNGCCDCRVYQEEPSGAWYCEANPNTWTPNSNCNCPLCDEFCYSVGLYYGYSACYYAPDPICCSYGGPDWPPDWI